jgi:23S rRNA pseudouridine1911/1915/1917 synthase
MPEETPGFQTRVRRPPPEPEAVPINILYEDDSLIAIDKPPGMVVHPTYRNWSGTLLNGLLWHVRGRPGVQPSIVTRLDKDTSGIVLVALTPGIHARVQKDAAAGLVRKEYLAVVRGSPVPEQGAIVLPLGRSPEDRRRVIVTSTGQHCHTTYEVLSTSSARALVRCEIVTGRTHQIRVHLASQGWPISGDRVYGEEDPVVARQALHAWRLLLPHPVTRRDHQLEAPVAPDLREVVDEFFSPAELARRGFLMRA